MIPPYKMATFCYWCTRVLAPQKSSISCINLKILFLFTPFVRKYSLCLVKWTYYLYNFFCFFLKHVELAFVLLLEPTPKTSMLPVTSLLSYFLFLLLLIFVTYTDRHVNCFLVIMSSLFSLLVTKEPLLLSCLFFNVTRRYFFKMAAPNDDVRWFVNKP